MVDIRPSRGPAHYDKTLDRLTILISQARKTGFEVISPDLTIQRTFTNSLGIIELGNASKLLKGVRDFSKVEISGRRLRKIRRDLTQTRTNLALVERYNPGIVESSKQRFQQEVEEVSQSLPEGPMSKWRERFSAPVEDLGADILFRGWLLSLPQDQQMDVKKQLTGELIANIEDL